MAAKKSKNNFVWIDMEMTGLDPLKEGIIEIATIITDSELNVVAEGPNLVVKQSEKLLEGMDSWNKKHHGKSGLLDEVRKSRVTLAKAEIETMKFVRRYCYKSMAPLCGNSIHHDRKFIARYMPKLDAYLHYRHIDVSTIKALVKNWYPKGKSLPRKKTAHRALDDILESIEELKFYRKHYFKRSVAGK